MNGTTIVIVSNAVHNYVYDKEFNSNAWHKDAYH